MKYIDADKLIKAIEEKRLDCSFALKMERLDTLALIDELQQEQQEVDLDKEIDKTVNECTDGYNFDWDKFALHFYELGKNSK